MRNEYEWRKMCANFKRVYNLYNNVGVLWHVALILQMSQGILNGVCVGSFC